MPGIARLKPWPCLHAPSSIENYVHIVSLYQPHEWMLSLHDHQQSCLFSAHGPHGPRA